MSFAEKVHNRLLALESQVQALDKRLKALEAPLFVAEVNQKAAQLRDDMEYAALNIPTMYAPVKRKPGRPKKVVNASN